MARGFVKSVDGTVVVLVGNREDIDKRDDQGKPVQVETKSLNVSKRAPLVINGRKECRVADLRNGDEVVLTEVGGMCTGGVVKRDPAVDVGGPAPAGTKVFTESDIRRDTRDLRAERAGRADDDTFSLGSIANNDPIDVDSDVDALLHRDDTNNQE